jgi:hypothetical protein
MNLVRPSSSIELPGCKLGANSLQIDSNCSLENWKAIGNSLKRIEGAVQWWIGDWIKFGTRKQYIQAASETGYDIGTMYYINATVAQFEPARRRDKLSFAHHYTVVKLPRKDQDEILDLAEKNNWTREELRDEVKKLKRRQDAQKGEGKELPPSVEVIHGDFRQVDLTPDSVDLILTDPPYPEEYLPLWGDLSIFAKKVLKPSGFFISYSGLLHLPKVMSLLADSLIHYWTFALLHKGVNQLVHPRNIFCGWKPILVFQKPPFKRIEDPTEDVIEGSGREKDLHDWQQSPQDLIQLISTFSKPDAVILDPCAGSGTTLVAGKDLLRNFIGIDIDEQNVRVMKSRLGEVR